MRRYSNEDVEEAVVSSVSFREVLLKLGITPKGGNYKTIKSLIEKLGLSTSHFTGQRWNAGRKTGEKRPVEAYLSGKYQITSYRLRLRLVAEGLLENKCYVCGLTEWLGRPIALELEHINGNHLDNSLGNLTILCPNCHAQTKTYRGRKLKKPKETTKVVCRKPKTLIERTCRKCAKTFETLKGSLCEDCRYKSKIEWPPASEIEARLKDTSYSQLARELGVSGNAIRKRLKKIGARRGI